MTSKNAFMVNKLFSKYFSVFLHRYFDIKSRAGRKEFITYFILFGVVGSVPALAIFFLVPLITCSIRRMNDAMYSKIYLILPFINLFFLLKKGRTAEDLVELAKSKETRLKQKEVAKETRLKQKEVAKETRFRLLEQWQVDSKAQKPTPDLGYKKKKSSGQTYTLSCTHQIRSKGGLFGTKMIGKKVWCEVCGKTREVTGSPWNQY